MRLAAMALAIGSAWVGSAGAATYFVTVDATPTVTPYYVGDTQRIAVDGASSFSDVILHPGDFLDLTVNFTTGVQMAPGPLEGDFGFNVPRGTSIDDSMVQLTYAPNLDGCGVCNVSVIGGPDPLAIYGFNIEASSYVVFGNPSPDATFDLNSIDYDFATVPEPSSWSLAIAGFIFAGAALRARGRFAKVRKG